MDYSYMNSCALLRRKITGELAAGFHSPPWNEENDVWWILDLDTLNSGVLTWNRVEMDEFEFGYEVVPGTPTVRGGVVKKG